MAKSLIKVQPFAEIFYLTIQKTLGEHFVTLEGNLYTSIKEGKESLTADK